MVVNLEHGAFSPRDLLERMAYFHCLPGAALIGVGAPVRAC